MESFLSLLSENDLNQSIIQIFEKAKKNRKIFILQNKTLPEIGDTDKNIIYPDIKSINGSFISPKSGYFIKKDLPKMYFIARTQSPLQNHRHNDASSFILYLNNEKIISETGFLDYSKTDTRNFIKSKFAHNILFADNDLSLSNNIGYFREYISDPNNIYFDPSNVGNSVSACSLYDGSSYTTAEPIVNQEQYDDCYYKMIIDICL